MTLTQSIRTVSKSRDVQEAAVARELLVHLAAVMLAGEDLEEYVDEAFGEGKYQEWLERLDAGGLDDPQGGVKWLAAREFCMHDARVSRKELRKVVRKVVRLLNVELNLN